jgi:hypothetical protein
MISEIDALATSALLDSQGRENYGRWVKMALSSPIPDDWQKYVGLPLAYMPITWSPHLAYSFPWCRNEDDQMYVLFYLQLVPALRHYDLSRRQLFEVANFFHRMESNEALRSLSFEMFILKGEKYQEILDRLLKVGMNRRDAEYILDPNFPYLDRVALFNREHSRLVDELDNPIGAFVRRQIGTLSLMEQSANSGFQFSFRGMIKLIRWIQGRTSNLHQLEWARERVETWFSWLIDQEKELKQNI